MMTLTQLEQKLATLKESGDKNGLIQPASLRRALFSPTNCYGLILRALPELRPGEIILYKPKKRKKKTFTRNTNRQLLGVLSIVYGDDVRTEYLGKAGILIAPSRYKHAEKEEPREPGKVSKNQDG